MIEIRNHIIPFGRAGAMTIWPFLLLRKKYARRLEVFPALYERMRRHEGIHTAQQKEMLILPFFVWYGLEWLFRSIQYRSFHTGYRNISFEREAYFFQDDVTYLERRRRWSWIRWLRSGVAK